MKPLEGLDAAFLSLETPTTPLHVGLVMVLDPPEGTRSLFSPSTRYAQIRRVIAQRVPLLAPSGSGLCGCRWDCITRYGSTTPISIWTITSPGRASRRRAARRSSTRSSPLP